MLAVLFLLSACLSGLAGVVDPVPKTGCTATVLTPTYGWDFAAAARGLDGCAAGPGEFSTQTLLRVFLWRWQFVPVAYSAHKEAYLKLLLSPEPGKRTKQTPRGQIYVEICRNLFLAEFHSSLNQTWQALRYAQRTYPYLVQVLDEGFAEPEFVFVGGLYHYYIEHYREKSMFFRVALAAFRDGSRAEGIRRLQQAALVPSTARVEAKIFLAHILLRLERRPAEALEFSEGLVSEFPANLKFHELFVENLLALGRYAAAEESIRLLEQAADPYFRVPAHYFRGLLEKEHCQRPALAVQHFEACASANFAPVAAYQRLASAQLRTGGVRAEPTR